MTLSTGQQLRQARQGRGLSVAQVATATHIRTYYLEALESDNYALLPSMTQVRGFVRAYAQYLKLDPEPLLTAMTSQTEPEPASEPQPALLAPLDSKADNIFHEIGDRLRQQREILGLSLEDIERQTHLRMHYLKALEEGRLDDLPSPVQGRGMLSNYARFLGFDADTVLLRFADGLQARLMARKATAQAMRPVRPAARRPRLLRIIPGDLLVVGIFTILLVVFITWAILQVASTRASLEAQATAPSVADVLALTTETPTPEQSADALTVAATSQLELSGTESPLQVASTEINEATPTATLPPLNPAPVQLYIAVRQRAWMRVTVDGKIAFEGRVTPGGAYIYSGNRRIEVLTGNGAALQVFYNRLDLGTLGILGQVVSRIFTPDGIQTPTTTATPLGLPPPTETPAPTGTSTITPSPTVRP